MTDVKLQTALSTYKDALELQKQLMEMLLNKNLQNDVIMQQNQQTAKAIQNVIEGTKVSIYA
jgi:exonuclease VII small subunit